MTNKFFIKPDEEIEKITNWIKKYFATNGSLDTKAVIGISGGKDSTVAAALLCRALGPERVIAVMMPQGTQADIADSYQVCNFLKIPLINRFEFNIENAVSALYDFLDCPRPLPSVVTTNTPARIRMVTLYAVAGIVGGRVCNTSNYSERYVGYSTKFGDSAGDFSLFQNYTATEVIQIGKALELPKELVEKTPADGLSGKTDEDNLGFTYEALDNYIRNDVYPDCVTYTRIIKAHETSLHKREAIRLPNPGSPWQYKTNTDGTIAVAKSSFNF